MAVERDEGWRGVASCSCNLVVSQMIDFLSLVSGCHDGFSPFFFSWQHS